MYQVIARKYRPQKFDELIGQEHVQKTLANAIESQRLAHGYIFSGQRGTGKTTVARILARCLNCIHGPTATPCGVCSSCTEVSAGCSPDVIEIDAASNRGINEMREIRENVRYRPARDHYKVFIIDEAHQITKEAFNALLKTLEEPPEWVVFILCTTEANEIPNTIASRCQQFTFRSVDFTELMNRMRFISEQEGIAADDEVLSVIAQAGEGSVRDSLSALDQAIACCGRTLSVEQVRSLLGMFGVDSLRSVADSVQNADGAAMLELVAELESTGQSLQHFSRELSKYWRNLLVARIAGKYTRLIAASEPEQERLRETATQFSEEDLTRYLNLCLTLYKDLQSSLQPRLHLELGLVKLVQAGRLQSIEAALAELERGDGGASQRSQAPATSPAGPGSILSARDRQSMPRPPTFSVPIPTRIVAPAAPPPPVPAASEPAPVPVAPRPVREQAVTRKPDPPATKAVEPAVAPASITEESVPESPVTENDFQQALHDALCKAGLQFSADGVQQAEVTLSGSDLLIRAPKNMLFSLKDAGVQKVASQVAGRPLRVKVEAAENLNVRMAKPAEAKGNLEESAIRERALSHPGVKRFQELFPGAQVRTVRNLNE